MVFCGLLCLFCFFWLVGMTVHSQFYPSSKCFNRKVIRTKRENGHLKGHFSGKEILALMKRIEIAHRKWLGLPALNFFEPPGKWFWPFWDLKPFHEAIPRKMGPHIWCTVPIWCSEIQGGSHGPTMLVEGVWCHSCTRIKHRVMATRTIKNMKLFLQTWFYWMYCMCGVDVDDAHCRQIEGKAMQIYRISCFHVCNVMPCHVMQCSVQCVMRNV